MDMYTQPIIKVAVKQKERASKRQWLLVGWRIFWAESRECIDAHSPKGIINADYVIPPRLSLRLNQAGHVVTW